MSEDKQIQANAEKHYEVAYTDLPLSCPMPSMKLWNSHPRVYLPIEETGAASCPYCSATFSLKNFDSDKAEKAETPPPF